jgi:hypothetical protein
MLALDEPDVIDRILVYGFMVRRHVAGFHRVAPLLCRETGNPNWLMAI